MGLRMERKLWSITVGTDLLGIGKKPGPGSGLMIPHPPKQFDRLLPGDRGLGTNCHLRHVARFFQSCAECSRANSGN